MIKVSTSSTFVIQVGINNLLCTMINFTYQDIDIDGQFNTLPIKLKLKLLIKSLHVEIPMILMIL